MAAQNKVILNKDKSKQSGQAEQAAKKQSKLKFRIHNWFQSLKTSINEPKAGEKGFGPKILLWTKFVLGGLFIMFFVGPLRKPETFGGMIWSWFKTIIGAIIVVMIINGLLIASFVVPTGSMEKTVMTGDFLFVNKFIYGPSTPQVIPFFNIPLPFIKFPGYRSPEKGDVIVFIFPGNRDEVESKEFQYYLKRCVATAGDTIAVLNKRLFVNGTEYKLTPYGQNNWQEPLSPYNKWETFPPGRAYTRDNYGPLRIPKKNDYIPLNQRNWREWEYFIKKEGHEITSDGNNIYIDNQIRKGYSVKRDYCFGMGDNRDNSLDSRYWGFIPVENVVGTPLIVYWSWPIKVKDVEEPAYKSDPDQERELTLFEKIARVRWNRVTKLIN